MSNESPHDFFDSLADSWDSHLKDYDYQNAHKALKRAEVSSSSRILDVGAGTGILIPLLKEIKVLSYLAIERSTQMANVLKQKFPECEVLILDYEISTLPHKSFDHIIIFNAFPHFNDPAAVFAKSHSYLAAQGKLVIAHSMNRETLNNHHRQYSAVEDDILPSDKEFYQLFMDHCFQNITVEDSDYFFACGTKA